MFKLHQMSIKQKVVLGVTLAVLASTLIVGVMAQRQAREVLEHRLVDLELPNILKLIKSDIDHEVLQLLASAQQIASNEFVQQAIATTERDSSNRSVISEAVEQLTRSIPPERRVGSQPKNGILLEPEWLFA